MVLVGRMEGGSIAFVAVMGVVEIAVLLVVVAFVLVWVLLSAVVVVIWYCAVYAIPLQITCLVQRILSVLVLHSFPVCGAMTGED